MTSIVDSKPVSGFKPFALERYFAIYEFSGAKLLCCSDCEPYKQSEIIAMADEEAKDLWDNLSLGYTESAGLPLLRREIAKMYGAVCTPDFFGYNKDLELQYRGRMRELKDLKPITTGDSDLFKAMKEIAKTGNGPKNQIPSMGCNIKWINS